VELPKDNGIRGKHRKHDEHEAEDQTGADVEPTAMKSFRSSAFDPTG
jgi:hypothetical protein